MFVKAAWDRAEVVSWVSGNPYNDRDGKRCNAHNEKIGAQEIVLRQWCLEQGLDYVWGQR